MSYLEQRLSKRLNLKTTLIEEVYELLSKIDAVKNSWAITGKLLPQTIERLTHSVIVTSTGASNRIEGNLLTDDQVEALYKNLRIKKFKTRDEQEVAGYLEMLEFSFEHFKAVNITENTILQIHRDMLKYSGDDERHRGQYKFASNRVEARDQSGNVVGVIFDPTPPHLVQKEMLELTEWYAWAGSENFKHPLILIANFIFEYLAIHPFQDGNGRTSRILTNIMLLQNGYDFTPFVSHEKIIEENKTDYYLALNKTQKTWKTDNEDLAHWLLFFLKTIEKQSHKALEIMEGDNIDYLLSEKQLRILEWGSGTTLTEFSRKDVIDALGMPPRTVEESIKRLVEFKKLEKLGQGRATRYKLINSR